MDVKYCKRCDTSKPLTEFRYRNKEKGILQYTCTACSKQAGKKHYTTNKTDIIKKASLRTKGHREKYQEFKQQLHCIVCNEDYSKCIDLHHLYYDESSNSDFSQQLGRKGWNYIKKELKKCVPLCSNCHRKVHGGRIKLSDEQIKHGQTMISKTLPH